MKSLEEILAHTARAARHIFKEEGEVRPMWVGYTAADELVIVLPEGFGNTDQKDEAIAAARKTFRERDVVQYAFMIEAWMVDSRTTDPVAFRRAMNISRTESLEFHPDRREVIQIQAEDRERCLMAHYFILRPEYGKPTLSPLVKPGGDGRTERSSGRMTHLLEPRT